MCIRDRLEFQTLDFQPNNDLPCALYVPAYAATAWYHKRLAPDLQKDFGAVRREAEAFAMGPYFSALHRGANLPPDERRTIAKELARLTGLSPEFVERCNLRIEICLLYTSD